MPTLLLDSSRFFDAARSLTTLLGCLFRNFITLLLLQHCWLWCRDQHFWWLQRTFMAVLAGHATTSNPLWRMFRPPGARLVVVRRLLLMSPSLSMSVHQIGWSWVTGPGLSYTVSLLTFLLNQPFNSRKMRGTSCTCFPGNQRDVDN